MSAGAGAGVSASVNAERRRLDDQAAGRADWQRWGTYVSDRAWGTVREDYSADGNAWDYFPHDHARSRAYRWNEDGLAGFCDREQHLCLGVALWNERDPILKERLFGLTNREGNHGEDVKEYYFYLDNTPTHTYARMLYKYPQVAYPYADLVDENARRGGDDPEYELFDAIADAFVQQRYFDVSVEYAKVDAEDILCRIRVINRGPEAAPIHVLPHLWYRNTWSWTHGATRHVIQADGVKGTRSARTQHPALGERWWYVEAGEVTGTGAGAGAGRDVEDVTLMFTENDTNSARLFGSTNATSCVKDGIHDAVIHGRRDRVDTHQGSKAAAHVRAIVPAGGSFDVRVRFSTRALALPFEGFDDVVAARQQEADAFYDQLHTRATCGQNGDEKLVQRQALAGLLWSKQFYHFDVYRWLAGDPAQPAPPPERRLGRNRSWALHLRHADIILMPDTWEYPWYASWDLAFHVVVMAMIDPEFAKQQLVLLTLPTTQHPYGAVPAFEWDFDAMNPPVLAWAAWQVYHLDRLQHPEGDGDRKFLARVFDSLVLMHGWWANRKDREGQGIFGGGFLGLDNIGLFDRDRPLPTGGALEQSDGTGWMALFQLNMAAIALELARHDARYVPFVQRFGQHFVIVSQVLQQTGAGGIGLWQDEDQFYFDVIRHGTTRLPLRIYSMVGLVPMFAAAAIEPAVLEEVPMIMQVATATLADRQDIRAVMPGFVETGAEGRRLLSVVDRERLTALLRRVLDEDQFLSEFGVRSLSRAHLERPYRFTVDGVPYEVAYRPGVSDNRMFGGNSNWRGPIWFPMNVLLIQAIATFARYYGDTFTLEHPQGSGVTRTLPEIGADLARRLTSIFLRDDVNGGARPVFGGHAYMESDPHWRDNVPFYEFFHAETGAGLGASHQTGWTALVALLLQYGGNLCFDCMTSQ